MLVVGQKVGTGDNTYGEAEADTLEFGVQNLLNLLSTIT